jgi:arginase
VTATSVSIIGAPTDVGAGVRGANMGPEALRVAGVTEATRDSHGALPPAP